jgi:ATP-binding cassette, subfamily G (WHITE), member 2, SNQ2
MDATTPPAQIEHDYAHRIDGNTRQQSDLGRIHSNVSHVQIDHFDPAGVAELQQTLSRATHQTGFSGVTLTGLGDGPFDLEKVLRHLMRRFVVSCVVYSSPSLTELFRRNESDIKTRELGVMFRDLRVVGGGAAVNYQPTFGSLFDPRIIWEGIKSIRHPPTRDILSGFEGVVRPGEMLCKSGNL